MKYLFALMAQFLKRAWGRGKNNKSWQSVAPHRHKIPQIAGAVGRNIRAQYLEKGWLAEDGRAATT